MALFKYTFDTTDRRGARLVVGVAYNGQVVERHTTSRGRLGRWCNPLPYGSALTIDPQPQRASEVGTR